jgi:hypothetical protein
MHQFVDVDYIVSLIRISIIDSHSLYRTPACPLSSSRVIVAWKKQRCGVELLMALLNESCSYQEVPFEIFGLSNELTA